MQALEVQGDPADGHFEVRGPGRGVGQDSGPEEAGRHCSTAGCKRHLLHTVYPVPVVPRAWDAQVTAADDAS